MKIHFTIAGVAGSLTIFNVFPNNSKSKVCYFVKKSAIALTVENFRENLIFGEIPPKPMNGISVLLDDIFYPILNNANNQVEWPEVIKKDIDLHVQDLRNAIAEVSVCEI